MLGDVPLAARAIDGQESPSVGSHGWQAGDVRVGDAHSGLEAKAQAARVSQMIAWQPGRN